MSTSSIFTPVTDKPGSDAAHAQQAVVIDQDYFMDLSPVIFQVENYLFRVPRYHLVRGSEFFANMFQSQRTQASLESSSIENPIVLPVNHVDFRNFLKLLYPQTVQAKLSKKEWLSVLKLSSLWYFRDLRQMALSELEEDNFGHLSSSEKIELGRESYIPECLLSGYHEFVIKHEFITDEEATAMGPLTAVRLCRIRETFMFDDDPEAGSKVYDYIELDVFRKEFVSLEKRAAGCLPSGLKMVDRRLATFGSSRRTVIQSR